MPKSKPAYDVAISDEEEARIQAGIVKDRDNPELTDEQLARMRPSSKVLPPALYAALTRPRGRPKLESPKVAIKLRLDARVVEAFKATGVGWQTRINECLLLAASKLSPAERKATSKPVKRSQE